MAAEIRTPPGEQIDPVVARQTLLFHAEPVPTPGIEVQFSRRNLLLKTGLFIDYLIAEFSKQDWAYSYSLRVSQAR